MCDYSLHHVSSRPARVADRLVTMEVAQSKARGFAALGETGTKLVVHDDAPQVAVCLLPGTELAFDVSVQYDRAFSPKVFGVRIFGKARVNYSVASFRQIDLDDPYVQHDALEFPNGQVVKIDRLIAGQTATVLQLPVTSSRSNNDQDHTESFGPSYATRLVLNRTVPESAVAAILVPNQGMATLWDAFRSTAISFQFALAQVFRRVTARKTGLATELPEADVHNSVAVAVLSQKLASPTSDKKTEIRSAAEAPLA